MARHRDDFFWVGELPPEDALPSEGAALIAAIREARQRRAEAVKALRLPKAGERESLLDALEEAEEAEIAAERAAYEWFKENHSSLSADARLRFDNENETLLARVREQADALLATLDEQSELRAFPALLESFGRGSAKVGWKVPPLLVGDRLVADYVEDIVVTAQKRGQPRRPVLVEAPPQVIPGARRLQGDSRTLVTGRQRADG